MKKILLSVFAFGLLLSSCADNGKKVEASEAETVEINETETTLTLTSIEENSHLKWFASHLGGISPRFGKIFISNAEILVNNGELSNASIIIDMNSLTVENFKDDQKQTDDLTGHLKSADFFNIEANPTSKFEMTNIETGNEEYNSKVTGNLSILDSTKSITFLANVNVMDHSVSILSEKFAIDRTLWGMIYHVEGSEGVPTDYLIANEVGFIIDVTVK